ncbi:MAG: MBL fold metallo-hydrolase [Ferruginibacter sp.]
MALHISSLNSGSNGNCYYIGNDDEAVLIDAGLSCRETEKRMALLGLSMKLVKGIFISHEHSDHIRGLERLATKYNLPVMITGNTCTRGGMRLKKEQVKDFLPYKPVMIGNISVTAFPKFHDAADPHSFMVSYLGINIGVFTDIGKPCERLTKYFALCHAAFLEANYDEALLENGRYPIYLKNRIRGGNGHLSNSQALEVFTRFKPSYMTHLFLSHLSKENNSPELVHKLFTAHSTGTNIIIASRHEATAVYTIVSTVTNSRVKKRIPVLVIRSQQLSLFE